MHYLDTAQFLLLLIQFFLHNLKFGHIKYLSDNLLAEYKSKYNR